MRRKLLGRPRGRGRSVVMAVLVTVSSVGLLSLQSSAQGDDYDPHPGFPGQGLPHIEKSGPGTWVPPQAVSVATVKRSKQWIRTPSLQLIGYSRPMFIQDDPTCRILKDPSGVKQRKRFNAEGVLVNPAAGANSGNRFGETQPFEVRTVAFGVIPVSATVVLEQPRSAKGVVIPALVTQTWNTWCAGRGDFNTPPAWATGNDDNVVYEPASMDSSVRVRVRELRVDGVALPLGKNCRAAGAKLTATSNRWNVWDPAIDRADMPVAPAAGVKPSAELLQRTPYYDIASGGLLHGELDVPAFSNCGVTSTGEDIARLLTASVSGPGNVVELRTEGLSGRGLPFEECPLDGSNCEPYFDDKPLPDSAPD